MRYSVFILVATFVFGCGNNGGSRGTSPSSSITIRVPQDETHVNTALGKAKHGDRVLLAKGFYASFLNTISFPATIPAGVTLEGEGTFYFDDVKIGGVSTQPGPAIIILEEGSTIRNLRISDITSSTPGLVGIAATNVGGVRIEKCHIAVNNGVLFDGVTDGLVIETVVIPDPPTIPTTSIGVALRNSVRCTVAKNTIVSTPNAISVTTSQGVTIEENILYEGQKGIHTDASSLVALFISYNNVHRYGNAGDGNYSLGVIGGSNVPSFVPTQGVGEIHDANNFLNLNKDLRMAGGNILAIAPARTAGKMGGWIGALPPVDFRTSFAAELHFPFSPTTQQRSVSTEVMRIDLTASVGGDVEFRPGHTLTFQVSTNRSTPLVTTFELRDLGSGGQGTIIATGQGTVQNGRTVTLSVVGTPFPISMGTTVSYSLFVDTTLFQSSDTLQFTLDRMEWSDGGVSTITDELIPYGRPLSGFIITLQ